MKKKRKKDKYKQLKFKQSSQTDLAVGRNRKAEQS